MDDLFGHTSEPAPLMVLPKREPKMPRLLDLPDDEMAALVRALGKVSFGFGGAGRIVDMMTRKPIVELSAKQRNAAIRIGWRYRRQMPAGVMRSLARWSRDTLKGQ